MIEYLLAGLLGVVFHTLTKMASLKKDFETANERFSAKKYFERDWIAIAMSIVAVVIAAYCVDELLQYKPAIAQWIKFFFVTVGVMGSWALQSALGKSKKFIRNIVDEKTNIADNVTTKNEE